MLIKLSTLIEKYKLKIKGVLHVGAHLCEEEKDYKEAKIADILWLEGNPQLVEQQRKKGFQNIFSVLVSDVDNQEVQFNITNNGQSSSILELGEHKTFYPHIHYIKHIKLKTKRIDTFYTEEKIVPEKYNFLNLDIQGMELKALQSMTNLLHRFDYVYTEVNTGQVYQNCAQLEDIDVFLLKYGFERKELSMTAAKWGDAFYVRSFQK